MTRVDRSWLAGLARRRVLISGFTLIAIVVAIVIIAVLATLVAPDVFRHVGAACDATARSRTEMLSGARDAYRLDPGAA